MYDGCRGWNHTWDHEDEMFHDVSVCYGVGIIWIEAETSSSFNNCRGWTSIDHLIVLMITRIRRYRVLTYHRILFTSEIFQKQNQQHKKTTVWRFLLQKYPQLTFIFFRGVGQPPTRFDFSKISKMDEFQTVGPVDGFSPIPRRVRSIFWRDIYPLVNCHITMERSTRHHF